MNELKRARTAQGTACRYAGQQKLKEERFAAKGTVEIQPQDDASSTLASQEVTHLPVPGAR